MTKIEYADETWNPMVGCSPCSPGCDNCYASRAACGRFLKEHPLYKGLAVNNKWTGEVRLCTSIGRPDILDKPLHWKEPRTIFVCNMGDLFHEEVPFEFIDKVFNRMICKAPQHTYLVLTKRPERMAEYIKHVRIQWQMIWKALYNFPLPNVYPGVTICNQAEADAKIPIPLQIPAAKRWISLEPMLGPVDLKLFKGHTIKTTRLENGKPCYRNLDTGARLFWVVLGCESGPNRRPCKLDWMIDVVEQCKAAGVLVSVKQVNINGRVSHTMSEWPEKLRIREGIIKKP